MQHARGVSPRTAILALTALLLAMGLPQAASAEDIPTQGQGVISGTVTAFDGGSVEGVCLRANSSLGADTLEATAEADGSYRFTDVPVGYYTIRAFDCRPDRVYDGFEVFTLDPEPPSRTAWVEVTGGEVDGIDLEFPETPARGDLDISGTIRLPEDHGGTPLCLRAVSTTDESRQTSLRITSVGANEMEREYTLSAWDETEDTYYVEAWDCEVGRLVGLYNGDAEGSATAVDDAVAVALGTTDVDLTLTNGNLIAGEVATVDGAEARMCVQVATEGINGTRTTSSVADDGTFQAAVVDGVHSVEASDCGEPRDRRYLPEVASVEVSGEDTTEVSIRLPRGARLTGQVTGPRGESFPSVWVDARSQATEEFFPSRADGGSFVIAPLPAGDYRLTARPPAPTFDPFMVGVGEVTVTTNAAGEPQDVDRDLTMALGAAVRFPANVSDLACLRPEQLDDDATITLAAASQLHTGEVLLSGLAPGTYAFTYGCDEPLRVPEVTLEAGDTVDLTTLEAVTPPEPEPEAPEPDEETEEDTDQDADEDTDQDVEEDADQDAETLPAFSDVPLANVHADNIQRLVDAGITAGCDEGAFCPNDVVTRDQMATFLTRALELEAEGPQPFADVPEGSTHDQSIRALVEAEITGGCDEGLYCPRDEVNRAQMATFLTRALELEAEGPQPFADVPEGSTHDQSIRALVEAEITGGCDEGLYCPGNPVTRAQMASFLVRALDL